MSATNPNITIAAERALLRATRARELLDRTALDEDAVEELLLSLPSLPCDLVEAALDGANVAANVEELLAERLRRLVKGSQAELVEAATFLLRILEVIAGARAPAERRKEQAVLLRHGLAILILRALSTAPNMLMLREIVQQCTSPTDLQSARSLAVREPLRALEDAGLVSALCRPIVGGGHVRWYGISPMGRERLAAMDTDIATVQPA